MLPKVNSLVIGPSLFLGKSLKSSAKRDLYLSCMLPSSTVERIVLVGNAVGLNSFFGSGVVTLMSCTAE